MSGGYQGKILRVDLSDKSCNVEEKPEKFYRKYFGGRNLIAHYLLEETESNIDPLGEENLLIFTSGVLTGTPLPGSGRNSVGAKSPVTGYFGEAEAGGFFGAALKKAGFDAVIFIGSASKPVYLWINDTEIEIRDASHLQGKKIGEAEEKIKNELDEKGIRTALIGPAGENLVNFACIVNDLSHVYGRNGLGAVMGSKNLKGIAVKGTNKVNLSDGEKVQEIASWLNNNVDDLCGWAKEMGTPGNVLSQNDIDSLPTRNFAEGSFEDADEISGEKMHSTILTGRDTCYACPVRCKQVVNVDEPYEVDEKYGGPEYETIASFGSMCGVSDLKAIAKAHEICNAYGLDTITAGGAIAFVMDCFENDIISESETGGLKLNFGNQKAMLDLLQQIVENRDFGGKLASGLSRVAEKWGPEAEKLLVEVKGQTIPYHDPRIKQGMALGYAVSPTGADHNHNIFDEFYTPGNFGVEEIKSVGILEGVPMKTLNSKKVRLFAERNIWSSLINSLHLCLFMPYSFKQQADMINAVTGWNSNTVELKKVGERSINLARIYNIREGLTEAEDDLPEKIFETPIGEDGSTVDKNELEEAKKLYYKLMNWTEDGIPTRQKLLELDIEWAEDYLP